MLACCQTSVEAVAVAFSRGFLWLMSRLAVRCLADDDAMAPEWHRHRPGELKEGLSAEPRVQRIKNVDGDREGELAQITRSIGAGHGRTGSG